MNNLHVTPVKITESEKSSENNCGSISWMASSSLNTVATCPMHLKHSIFIFSIREGSSSLYLSFAFSETLSVSIDTCSGSSFCILLTSLDGFVRKSASSFGNTFSFAIVSDSSTSCKNTITLRNAASFNRK